MAEKSENLDEKHSPENLSVPVQIFILNFMAIIIAIISFICRYYIITDEMNCLPIIPAHIRHKDFGNNTSSSSNNNMKNSNRKHRFTVRRKCRKSSSSSLIKTKMIISKKSKDTNMKCSSSNQIGK